MQGNVYLASWKKVGRGYKLWLDEAKDVAVTAPDFEDAAELLCEKLGVTMGDQEAVLDFYPPVPAVNGGRKSPFPSLVLLGFNSYVELAGSMKRLYQKPFCPTCGSPTNGRSDVPIQLQALPKADLCCLLNSPTQIRLCTQAFCDLLRLDEVEGVTLRNGRPPNDAGQPVYEIEGKQSAYYVGVKGAEYLELGSRCCPDCSYRTFLVSPEIRGASRFLAHSDLSNPLPACFLTGFYKGRIDICVTLEKWHAIRGKKGTRGIVAHPVGIVGDQQLDRNPVVRVLPTKQKK